MFAILMCVYHVLLHLFMHSCIYFHIVAIMNNAAMNMRVQTSFRSPPFILLGIHPEVELLDCMVVLFACLGQLPCLCHYPTDCAYGFHFLHLLTNVLISWFVLVWVLGTVSHLIVHTGFKLTPCSVSQVC